MRHHACQITGAKCCANQVLVNDWCTLQPVPEMTASIRCTLTFNSFCWQVKLIVIDSITFHFRQDFQDMAQRTRILAQMAQNLMRCAENRELAVCALTGCFALTSSTILCCMLHKLC